VSAPSHLFRALTPHWERRHLAGAFDSVHAGKMPALPVLRKNVRSAQTVTNACCFQILRVVILLAVADNQPKQ